MPALPRGKKKAGGSPPLNFYESKCRVIGCNRRRRTGRAGSADLFRGLILVRAFARRYSLRRRAHTRLLPASFFVAHFSFA